MCLFVLLGVLVPRVTLALLWLLTDWTRNVFAPWWLGVLGFLFLPYTTLAWVLLHQWSGAVGPTTNLAHLIILLIAVILDLGSWGGAHRTRTVRRTVIRE